MLEVEPYSARDRRTRGLGTGAIVLLLILGAGLMAALVIGIGDVSTTMAEQPGISATTGHGTLGTRPSQDH
jgi:hypothetical protein